MWLEYKNEAFDCDIFLSNQIIILNIYYHAKLVRQFFSLLNKESNWKHKERETFNHFSFHNMIAYEIKALIKWLVHPKWKIHPKLLPLDVPNIQLVKINHGF